jgi:pentapeptide repeat protein
VQADLTNSDLRGATLTGANVEQATLTGVKSDPDAHAALTSAGSTLGDSGAGAGVDESVTLVPYIIGGCVLLTALMIRISLRRARYSSSSFRRKMRLQQAGLQQTGPQRPMPQQPAPPPMAFDQTALPVSSAPPAEQPYSPAMSFTGTDWTPPSVIPDNRDAQHVVEEPKNTRRWFRN